MHAWPTSPPGHMQRRPIKFSSRTDAGVHALANSAHVDIIRRHRKTKDPVQEPYKPEAIMSAMNHHIRWADTFCRVTHVWPTPLLP